MTTRLKEISESLMTLPQSERIELADALYGSAAQDPPQDVERAWSDEVRKRLDDYQSGRASCHTEEEVHKRILKVLDETRRRVAGGNR